MKVNRYFFYYDMLFLIDGYIGKIRVGGEKYSPHVSYVLIYRYLRILSLGIYYTCISHIHFATSDYKYLSLPTWYKIQKLLPNLNGSKKKLLDPVGSEKTVHSIRPIHTATFCIRTFFPRGATKPIYLSNEDELKKKKKNIYHF